MADYPKLSERQALPDALRVLVEEFPRAGWEAHPNFGGLVQFWLERHQGFRQIHALMTEDVRAVLEREAEAEAWKPRLSHYGGMFLNSLHGHHMIEDHEYFPTLARLDARVTGGFDMLEKDHEEIDGLLHDFADKANAVLGAEGPDEAAAKAFAGALDRMGRLLDRHLSDEEELVVPVVLKTGVG